MNPISQLVGVIGSVSSLFGMGNSMVTQGRMTYNQLHPTTQSAQAQQQCPLGTKLSVVVKPDGTRELVCAQEVQ